jgi:hypothetical protein
MEQTDTGLLRGQRPEETYVAFIDILGFSRKVKEEYNNIIEAYENILTDAQLLPVMVPGIQLRIFSDSLMVTAKDLLSIITSVNALHQVTLFHDCLIRGGIAYGKHVEVAESGNLYLVSQSLIKAIEIEKSINNPCVVLHPDIIIPREWWPPVPNPFLRKLMYYEGNIIVSPFNLMWGLSAMTRVSMMLERYPDHHDKYNWFLKLYKAVWSAIPLVPPEIAKYYRRGEF